jgi:hypothetical protein
LIDEVSVYDRALTTAEIANIYQMASVPEPSAAVLAGAALCVAELGIRRRRVG